MNIYGIYKDKRDSLEILSFFPAQCILENCFVVFVLFFPSFLKYLFLQRLAQFFA